MIQIKIKRMPLKNNTAGHSLVYLPKFIENLYKKVNANVKV